jgi:diketogulonate reductase-like aldo/keto reductase
MGTWNTFDVGGDAAEREPLLRVLRVFYESGARLIDSSPMYGNAERVTGDLVQQLGKQAGTFFATKVWTSGRDKGLAQIEHSLRVMKTPRLDLLQIHNLLDWRTHLPTLRAMKADGRIRYVGITHYTSSAYREVEAVLRAEPVDFLQINYALDDRTAEARLLPLAQERGVAVIVNMPFGGGGLLRRLKDEPLPGWAAEIGAQTWAQVLLKYVLGHPAVTCVIPGTGRPEHMAENARAASGPLPDARLRARIAADWKY